MRIIIDIAEGFVDRWGALVVEPVPPVQGQPYKPPKITVPCFAYRIPADPNQAVFRATVGPIPQSTVPDSPPGVVTAAKTADSKPDLKLHEETQAEPEPADSEQEPQEQSEAVPSDEEQGGDAEPDDNK